MSPTTSHPAACAAPAATLVSAPRSPRSTPASPLSVLAARSVVARFAVHASCSLAAPRSSPASPFPTRSLAALLIALATLTLTPASGALAADPVTTTTDAPPSTPAAVDADDPTDEHVDDSLVPAGPTRKVSYAARLVVPVTVRKSPSGKAKSVTRLQPFGTWNGGPVVLSIAQVRTVNGKRWLRVRLPIRPNGATGWLLQDNVEVRKLRYRVEVNRRTHGLTLLRDGQKIGGTKVVLGAAATPTPAGQFAVLEVVRQPKGSVLGGWALHLTAHSNVLDNYGGGPGRVALHGRSGGLLKDPLGTSRSHGCIRMPNDFIARLSKLAVEGTPVVVR